MSTAIISKLRSVGALRMNKKKALTLNKNPEKDLTQKKILTVVFMIPVPCVRIELAICRILIVFKCLLLLVRSIKICNETNLC